MFIFSVQCVILFHFGLTDSFKMGKKLTVYRKSYHPIEFFLSKIVVFRKHTGQFFIFIFSSWPSWNVYFCLWKKIHVNNNKACLTWKKYPQTIASSNRVHFERSKYNSPFLHSNIFKHASTKGLKFKIVCAHAIVNTSLTLWGSLRPAPYMDEELQLSQIGLFILFFTIMFPGP